MGRPKKYLTATLSFGKTGDPVREYVENFIEHNGKRKLSLHIRDLIRINMHQNEGSILLQKRKEAIAEMNLLHKKLKLINEEIEKQGSEILNE